MGNEHHKLVSVVITTYNRVSLLHRAVQSVLNQTYNPIELIIVDDASSDETSEYCKTLSAIYIYIPPKEKKGGNYARNRGIKASNGEYIAFLDDDDYWLPSKIEKQVNLIENKQCNTVFCGRFIETVRNDRISKQKILPLSIWNGDLSKRTLYTICTTTSCLLIKKQALLDIGLFDENLSFWQEYELTIRLSQKGFFYFVNEPLCVYRLDARDKNRLTNKYDCWKSSVAYIHNIHKELYAHLNCIEKLRSKLLVLHDAAIRCLSSGRTVKYLFFFTVWYISSLPFRIADILQCKMQKSSI